MISLTAGGEAHRDKARQWRRFQESAIGRLNARQHFQCPFSRNIPQKATHRIDRRTIMMPHLSDGDQRRQGVTHHRQTQCSEPFPRQRRQFKRQLHDRFETHRYVPKPASQCAHREDRHRESFIFSVKIENRLAELVRFCAAGVFFQPYGGCFARPRELFGRARHRAKRGPAESGRADIAQDAHTVAPASVGVGVIGQPFEPFVDQFRVLIVYGIRVLIENGNGSNRRRGGKSAAGKFARPNTFFVACRQQCRRCFGQGRSHRRAVHHRISCHKLCITRGHKFSLCRPGRYQLLYLNSAFTALNFSIFRAYSRPAARINGRSSSISYLNTCNETCCAPSLQASAGFGCTSISKASAPIATAPLHMAMTKSALPAPWLGSITIGHCDSFLIIGTVERSSVLRVYVSKVRIPRSQNIRLQLPLESTYSPASSHSSIFMESPRFNKIGFFVLAAPISNWKFCAFLAPICKMSAYSATISACASDNNSVIIARPVSRRALARSLSPFSPSPWNSYGEVRGLNAPPRKTVAPASLTAFAVAISCFSLSTEHGPAITWNFRPPITLPRTSM